MGCGVGYNIVHLTTSLGTYRLYIAIFLRFQARLVWDEMAYPLEPVVSFAPCSGIYSDRQYRWLNHSPLLQLECVRIWKEPIHREFQSWRTIILFMHSKWSASLSFKVILWVWHEDIVLYVWYLIYHSIFPIHLPDQRYQPALLHVLALVRTILAQSPDS